MKLNKAVNGFAYPELQKYSFSLHPLWWSGHVTASLTLWNSFTTIVYIYIYTTTILYMYGVRHQTISFVILQWKISIKIEKLGFQKHAKQNVKIFSTSKPIWQKFRCSKEKRKRLIIKLNTALTNTIGVIMLQAMDL